MSLPSHGLSHNSPTITTATTPSPCPALLARSDLRLNSRPSSMQGSPSTEEEEPDQPINSRDEPQQHIDQIEPNRPLHPFDPTIPLSVLMNVHIPEQSEESGEEDTVFNPTLAKPRERNLKSTHKTTKSHPQAHIASAGHASTIADTAPIVPTAVAYPHFESEYLCSLCAFWRSCA